MAIIKRRNTVALVAELEALKKVIEALREQIRPQSERVNIDAVNGVDFYEIVADFEAQLIGSALAMARGRQNKAAQLLKLSKSTLNWKIKKLHEKLDLPR